VAEVVRMLQEKADLFTSYVRGNGLVLNAGKTQLLFSKGADISDVSINVSGSAVVPANKLSLLGVTFDRTLNMNIHGEMVAVAARQRAGIIARLPHHVPRGTYLRTLATGLVNGKVLHALAAVSDPRLDDKDNDNNNNVHHRSTQIAMNDVARTLTGTLRSDHVRVADLLASANLPSFNELAVVATATETWRAYHSKDGGQGNRNPLGQLMFDGGDNVLPDARQTRSAAAGRVPVPLRGVKTFVTNGAKIWNSCPALRAAKSIKEAKRVAKDLGRNAPI
jgi:hypothetical protein